MKEDRRTSSCCSVFIKADIQAILILIFILNDVLAVFHVQIRIVLDIDHLVVVHTFTVITGPVGIVIYLDIGNRTAGVLGNTEGFIEGIGTDRSLAAAFLVICICTKTVLSYKSRSGKKLLPCACLISFEHINRSRGRFHGHGVHYKQLFYRLILRLRDINDPFRCVRHALNRCMQSVGTGLCFCPHIDSGKGQGHRCSCNDGCDHFFIHILLLLRSFRS